MYKIRFTRTKDRLELEKEIRIKIIKEMKETVGCSNCEKLNRISEKSYMLYKEKR